MRLFCEPKSNAQPQKNVDIAEFGTVYEPNNYELGCTLQ